MGPAARRVRFVWLALLVVAVAIPGAAVAQEPAVFPTGVISDTTPTIRANVVDLQQMPPESGVELYVDGNRKTAFSYNRYSGALS